MGKCNVVNVLLSMIFPFGLIPYYLMMESGCGYYFFLGLMGISIGINYAIIIFDDYNECGFLNSFKDYINEEG